MSHNKDELLRMGIVAREIQHFPELFHSSYSVTVDSVNANTQSSSNVYQVPISSDLESVASSSSDEQPMKNNGIAIKKRNKYFFMLNLYKFMIDSTLARTNFMA
jgi:hypothetical protein